MFTRCTDTAATIIIAPCWANCNSLNRSSKYSLSILDQTPNYSPSYFVLGSGWSNFVTDQNLYSFTAGTDHPRSATDFVLANSNVTGLIQTSFVAHYWFVNSFRCRVAANSIHSMSIVNFKSKSTPDFLRLPFITTVNPIVAVH